MPRLPGPSELVIRPVLEDITVYRVVKVDDRGSSQLLEDFKSNHDLGRPLRSRSPESTYRAIWHGISVFEELEQAQTTARKLPQLGEHVAQVVLQPGQGFSLASWGSLGHASAWGDPSSFRDAVTDIVPVNTPETEQT